MLPETNADGLLVEGACSDPWSGASDVEAGEIPAPCTTALRRASSFSDFSFISCMRVLWRGVVACCFMSTDIDNEKSHPQFTHGYHTGAAREGAHGSGRLRAGGGALLQNRIVRGHTDCVRQRFGWGEREDREHSTRTRSIDETGLNEMMR